MNDELQFANIKLDEQTMTKMIAYLVIQVSNLQKENADNINRIHKLEEEIDKEYIEKVYYKSRIDKSIKYMEKELGDNREGVFKAFGDLDYAQEEVENLYRILKGGNNE